MWNTFSVKPNNNARKWVKERLIRHPGQFRKISDIVIGHAPNCWLGEEMVRLQNIQDGWSAWFPIKDIDISDSVE